MDKELLKQYYEEGKKFGYALARGATDLPSVQTFDELYTKHLHKPVVSGKRPSDEYTEGYKKGWSDCCKDVRDNP